MKHIALALVVASISNPLSFAQEAETLPLLVDGRAPTNFAEMWAGFDPRAEPLEIETLKEWEQDDVVLRIVRFRIGVFKGKKATLAAIYGYPKRSSENTEKLPGLVQIHGGGQYAHYNACLTNAKRGYATVSIAWAGRINAPAYSVSPAEVKLFWDGKTDDPTYKLTTDWGALDGYHAPGRNAGNSFPSATPAAWTLDAVESPRNSGWFLCALAARRALTFLEQQPEVDPDQLGVYGHSMGGKLAVMTAVDPRVKAAAPSCGGISDRANKSALFRSTVGDDVSLKEIACPIVFLSPSNDFHGRIGDLPSAVSEIKTDQWRVTCSPHHNHQDTSDYEVATQLWFDEHLKKSFVFPRTPKTELQLRPDDRVPSFTVVPDPSKAIASVDVYYTQHGKPDELPEDREQTMHRFWHYAEPIESNGRWTAKLPLTSDAKPLWVYANVRYSLASSVTGAGYYYGTYTTDSFNVSSLLEMVPVDDLAAADVRATRQSSLLIEDFEDDWEKEWYTYKPDDWARSTNKLRDETWESPENAALAIDVQTEEPNSLVVLLDNHAAVVSLDGGDGWQHVVLAPKDFANLDGEALADFNVMQLKLCSSERLKPIRGSKKEARVVGGKWQGFKPQFRNLRWTAADPE